MTEDTERPVDRSGGMDREPDGRTLVAAVRAAAARHNLTWEALVPDSYRVDLAHEEAEELAYLEMEAEKGRLRDHICRTYGITYRELSSLARP
ncbi:hypothetical protein [Sphingomonas sp.]|uniref:hypothetical protein n=1 Tax=Sphingomonas sp. TaxID=28214 RepID=UPI003B3B2C04